MIHRYRCTMYDSCVYTCELRCAHSCVYLTVVYTSKCLHVYTCCTVKKNAYKTTGTVCMYMYHVVSLTCQMSVLHVVHVMWYTHNCVLYIKCKTQYIHIYAYSYVFFSHIYIYIYTCTHMYYLFV